MTARGVNRVTIVVRDLNHGKAFYSQLLGATFHSMNDADAEKFGIRVAAAWDAGIELVSPIPGRESTASQFLEKHGEGLMGVVFEVDDVDAAKAAAEQLGVRATYALEYDKQTIDKIPPGPVSKVRGVLSRGHRPTERRGRHRPVRGALVGPDPPPNGSLRFHGQPAPGTSTRTVWMRPAR